MQNDWMKDETLKDIEPYKLEFLQALVFETGNLKKEQLLPFFMAVAKRSKEQNISFSDEEIASVTQVIKKHASPEELTKIEKIMAMRKKQH